MSKVFYHNGKKFYTEAEYYASVVKNGEVRNSVSLAAARYYYNRCLALYEILHKQNPSISPLEIETPQQNPTA